MSGIQSIGTYLPKSRLSRASIARALTWLAPGLEGAAKGHRTLAFWDEDSTTMGVEAARDCLSRLPCETAQDEIALLYFATVTPAFAERQNASLVHAALRLPKTCAALDIAGTPRGGLLAVKDALETNRPTLVVAADKPIAMPGTADEMQSGDSGAAIVTGQGDGLFRYCGGATVTSAFTERYRRSGDQFATNWEERWVRNEGYLKLMPEAITRALEDAACTADSVAWLIMPATIRGIGAAVAEAAGLSAVRIADTLAADCGDTGSGHALLMLAAAMNQIRPGDRLLVAQFGQGATALLFEASEAVDGYEASLPTQRAGGIEEDCYLKLPIFSGLLPWGKGLRGRVAIAEALSVAHRYSDALLGFEGGRCRETGSVQFPPTRISANPQAPIPDTQEPVPLADVGGRIATRTADKLAFSHHPPNCYGLVDFNGGGRLMMDFTDTDASLLHVGDEVRFVFRIKDIDAHATYHRYFWKAVSVPSAPSAIADVPAPGSC
ncbi:MAG: 3-oxoacyl-[acyl-carrier-protein] synthase III C-terminal domain-containing protein [Pseudomonadota bacterium]